MTEIGPRIRRGRAESGQGLVLFALAGAVLLGLVALAVDVGMFLQERRSLQNGVDAASLAGAIELPQSNSLAGHNAREWAKRNGIEVAQGDEVTVTVSNDQTAVTVEVARDVPFLFGRVLGLDVLEVKADATAKVGSPASLAGVLPFGVLEDAIDYDGGPTLLKYDAQSSTTGNFGPIRVDGSGASTHEDSIMFGSENSVCGMSQPSCEDPTAVTETGNMIGATRDGFQYRFSNTSVACDEFDEVLIPVGDGTYRVNASCNPFTGSNDSHRLVLIPVIESLCNGSCVITIKYFVGAFLEDFSTSKCKGNSCEVTVRFVKVVADPTNDAVLGIYDADSGIKFVRLVE